MSNLFEQPVFLLLIPLGLVFVWKLVRQNSYLGFSSSDLLEGLRVTVPLLVLERLAISLFIIAGVLMLARPVQIERISVPVYAEARDITIVLDISGSMSGENINTAASVLSAFAAGRPNDRIGLVIFDTQAYLEWPLSPDHDVLVYRLKHIEIGGGTTIASGFIAGLEHQKKYGQNPGAVIVVSDGSSDLKSEEKAAIEAALGKTKVYFIQIGTPDDLAKAFWEYIRSIGGIVYNGEIKDLGAIFTEISKLETSPVIEQQHIRVVYQFGILPYAAIFALLVAAIVHRMREV